MTAQSKAVIKGYFQTDGKPTQAQFENLIDSYQDTNQTMEAIASAVATGTGLIQVVNASSVTMVNVSFGSAGTLLAGAESSSSARTLLGLGTAAVVNTGTSTGTIPIYNASGGLTGLVESISGHITTPATAAYVLEEKAPYAYTINSLVIKASAGTATVSISVDGSAATGLSAVPVSAAQTSAAATGGNAVPIGGRVTLTFTALTSAPDTSFSLKTTR